MKEYIKYQLNKIDLRAVSQKEITASLKGIYAVLESKGHNIHEIKEAIDNVIIENIKTLMDKHRKRLE